MIYTQFDRPLLRLPQPIMVNAFDIETFFEKNMHKAYCVFGEVKNNKFFYYLNFKKQDIVWNSIIHIFSLLKKNEKCSIYVHNLDFDGTLILESIATNDVSSFFKVNSILHRGSIYSLKIKNKEKEISFLCSYKFLPLNLKTIAESFNLPSKMPFPYKFSNYNNINYVGKLPSEIYFNNEEEYARFKIIVGSNIFSFKLYSILYCKRDVLITKSLMSILIKIIKDGIGINGFKAISAPSLSLEIFIKKFNNGTLKTKTNITEDNLIRNGYFGGRCEVFENCYNSDNIFHFDFSGMYGLCMKEKFCFGKWKIFDKFKKENINKDFITENPGFYFGIFFSSSRTHIPVLPHKNEINEKLMFTNGIIEGIYWFEEIILAMDNGTKILSLKYALLYENFDNVFDSFVNFFNNVRKQGGAYKIFGKLMINSLYGRLGMDEPTSYTLIMQKEEFESFDDLKNVISVKNINNYYIVKLKNVSNNSKKNRNFHLKKSNVAIAAAITAKARIRLYKGFISTIKNNGKILYCDTDSIFASFKNNVVNEKHGEIYWDSSKNDTLIEKAIFALPKTYALRYKDGNDKVILKGVKNTSLSFEEFKEKYHNKSDILFDQLYFKKDGFFIYKNELIKKINIQTYDKRKFDSKNEFTRPYFKINRKYL